MPCGRESGSTAAVAAVSAWRLRLLLLVLMLVLFSGMPHGALSRGLALPPQQPPMVPNIKCFDTPYPFGVRGRSLLGFEVTCGPNHEAMLKIDEHSYKIDHVSLEGGFVVIFAGPISQVCYHSNGKQTQTTGIGNISLDGTPFSFSKRNKLVATGCNYRLVANFGNSVPVDSRGQSTTCSSYCDGSSETVDCLHGVACCEASVPTGAAQQFTMEFGKISGNVIGDDDGTCSAAFFLDQDDQVFMDGRGNGQKPMKDMLLPAGDHRMILDWVVGGSTCDQGASYNLAPIYCNSMSGCIDAPSGAGYLCKCKAGYDGNPYTADGCLGKYFFIHQRYP